MTLLYKFVTFAQVYMKVVISAKFYLPIFLLVLLGIVKVMP